MVCRLKNFRHTKTMLRLRPCSDVGCSPALRVTSRAHRLSSSIPDISAAADELHVRLLCACDLETLLVDVCPPCILGALVTDTNRIIMQWMLDAPLHQLMGQAMAIRDERQPDCITFSPKVFLPVTKLCRDTCGYCTFAQPPKPGKRNFMLASEVMEIALDAQAAGCTEALITVGDKPELKYPEAAQELQELGFETSIGYIVHLCALILKHTSLLPHVNAGVVTRTEMAHLREVSVSMGLMLESSSESLQQPGSAHYDCPDKVIDARLQVIRDAETAEDRVHDLRTLHDMHQEYGHLQELIIQPFKPKPGTRMAHWSEPPVEDLLRTIAIARILFGSCFNIQAPPNLSFAAGSTTCQQADSWMQLLDAGINDFGGVSPLTRDYVNPESAWPHLSDLCAAAADRGKNLLPRLPIYKEFLQGADEWLSDKRVIVNEEASPASSGFISPLSAALQASDASGFGRASLWHAGEVQSAPQHSDSDDHLGSRAGESLVQERDTCDNHAQSPVVPRPRVLRWAVERGVHGNLKGCASPPVSEEVQRILAKHTASMEAEGHRGSDMDWQVNDVVSLIAACGNSAEAVVNHADAVRKKRCGDSVSYVVNRNINYTNICTYACGFCAFSKGRIAEEARDAAYLLPLPEIQRRVAQAWDRGATEVCLQGGIHPDFTGNTYLQILQASFLQQLQEAGLGSLPGTAAEVLTDRVRSVICPDKLTTSEWLEVIRSAHAVGLNTTSTIMFGHVDTPSDWAQHLLAIRLLQQETNGITEFVPLPFVHMEAPLFRQGRARTGPTLHEAVMMHAVARIVLDPGIANIQASWVKMGPQWAQQLLMAGANDMGGSIMNESITRAAGAAHGQELTPSQMESLILGVGRSPWQRSTLYSPAQETQVQKSFTAGPLIS